jgi:hypothetical protein
MAMRTRITRAAVAIAATALLAPASAHAQYLDPGAGSIIVQAVVAAVFGIGVTVKLYWHRISAFLHRGGSGKDKPRG